MLFMHNSKYKSFIISVVVVLIAGVGWLFIKEFSETKSPGGHIPNELAATDALRTVLDAANEISGITSGAVFNYELGDSDGHFANFGIIRYLDDVRADAVIDENAFIFDELGGNGHAEVDRNTIRVVSFQRSVPEFARSGDPYPAKQLEETARKFVERVYPEFTQIESNLTPELGIKDGPEGGSHFLRWNDKQFAVPSGLDMDIPPFIQVGINSRGFIFSYDNTVQLYHNLAKEDLRKLCGFVEMPQTDDSLTDREKGIMKVWFTEYEPFQNRYLILPYEPETDFAGCSESAKQFLQHIRDTIEEKR